MRDSSVSFVRSAFDIKGLAAFFAFLFFLVTKGSAETLPGMRQITHVPERIDSTCRNGAAKVYDECSDQLILLANARRLATKEGKTILVVYGAEWCIWCHVLNSHFRGETNTFTYTYGTPDAPEERFTDTVHENAWRDVSKDATLLNSFVADKFVVLEIDSMYAPNGEEVLNQTGSIDAFQGSIPFVFTLRKNGQLADVFEHEKAEVSRNLLGWYRGYDRVALLAEMQRMHIEAQR